MLFSNRTIIEAAIDLYEMNVEIGFDDNFNLLIALQRIHYDDATLYSNETIVIDKNEAYNLARRLKTTLAELPQTIDNHFSASPNYSDYGDYSDVKTCFEEIKACLAYDKCRYRIVKNHPEFTHPTDAE